MTKNSNSIEIEDLKNKWKLACVRALKLHEQAEPIVFSRFGNDPEKSLNIPANFRKAKKILKKIRRNTRIMKYCLKKWKALKQ
jgi:hypothetical protein